MRGPGAARSGGATVGPRWGLCTGGVPVCIATTYSHVGDLPADRPTWVLPAVQVLTSLGSLQELAFRNSRMTGFAGQEIDLSGELAAHWCSPALGVREWQLLFVCCWHERST